MRKFVLALFITIVITGTAFASEIRQVPYTYSFEFAGSPAEPAFVICDGCPPRRAPALAPRIAPPAIFIRVSGPEHALPGPARPEPAKPAHVKSVSVRKAPEWTVHFAFDSHALRPGEKEKLKAVQSLVRGPVNITGYTDDIGTQPYNMRLSLERAEVVARFLRQIGIIPAAIIGKGECCSVSHIKKLNRRVEIKEMK
ncbi:MAG: OmpA family protein [Nitrospiraceae bacterium]|nr:OmpA family protein [Nitrospiraceae bacterium]